MTKLRAACPVRCSWLACISSVQVIKSLMKTSASLHMCTPAHTAERPVTLFCEPVEDKNNIVWGDPASQTVSSAREPKEKAR
jgi:hypothetical protein